MQSCRGWTAEFLPECTPLLLTALLCSALSLLWETFVQSSFSGKDGVGVFFFFFFAQAQQEAMAYCVLMNTL